MTTQTPDTFPAEISCLFIGGLEEILGRDETIGFVHSSGQNPEVPLDENEEQILLSPTDIKRILSELTARYGLLGSRGLILRVGRVFFKDFYLAHHQDLGLLDLNYRMLPKPERIKVGLEKIAHEFAKLYPGGAIVVENENAFSWTYQCAGRSQECETSRMALIYFFLGIFQEFLAWVTGGKYFHPVREIEDNDANSIRCIIEVDKHFIS